MQHAQSRTRSRRWIGRGALVALAGAAVFGVSPVLPALAATWSSPVALPGSCGSSVAVNQAGAMAAGGTFTASMFYAEVSGRPEDAPLKRAAWLPNACPRPPPSTPIRRTRGSSIMS